MQYAKGRMIGNVKSVWNIFARSTLKNMLLSIEGWISKEVDILLILLIILKFVVMNTIF